MFIKLFVINMVASSFFGLSNNFTTKLFPLVFSVCWSNCVWESEKKAISDPEIKAEQINRNTNTKLLIVISKSNFNTNNKNILAGSESKF